MVVIVIIQKYFLNKHVHEKHRVQEVKLNEVELLYQHPIHPSLNVGFVGGRMFVNTRKHCPQPK